MQKKISLLIALSFIIMILFSCKKEPSSESATYSSVKDFLSQNAQVSKTYTVNASTGGSFTTVQGTTVTIPANNFTYPSGKLVTSIVNIEFNDIYKKSDMLFADVATVFEGKPLKSAGEFFIRAIASDSLVQITNKIDIQQPANGKIDSMMLPFIGNVVDSLPNNVIWNNDSLITATLTYNTSDYIFSLYRFNSPVANGTWCNSDNSSYFQNYPTTMLTLQDTANSVSGVQVFLLFKNINSMVHIYESTTSFFPYSFAPIGLECTVVAIGINSSGKLVASFTPITIGSNQTVLFGLNIITETEFKATLTALN